jgi:hypothetical protein
MGRSETRLSFGSRALESPSETGHRCDDGGQQDEIDQAQHPVLLVQRGEALVVGL